MRCPAGGYGKQEVAAFGPLPADRVPLCERTGTVPDKKSEKGYGIIVVVGLFGGLAIGIAAGQPSAGVVIGGGIGLLAAVILSILR